MKKKPAIGGFFFTLLKVANVQVLNGKITLRDGSYRIDVHAYEQDVSTLIG